MSPAERIKAARTWTKIGCVVLVLFALWRMMQDTNYLDAAILLSVLLSLGVSVVLVGHAIASVILPTDSGLRRFCKWVSLASVACCLVLNCIAKNRWESGHPGHSTTIGYNGSNLQIDFDRSGETEHAKMHGAPGYYTCSFPLRPLADVLSIVAITLWLADFRKWFPWCDPQYAAGQCRTCGYDLTGNVSGICPECGKAVDARSQADR